MVKPKILKQIQDIVGVKNVSFEADILVSHSKDASHISGHSPDLVVWPQNTKHVSALCALAYKLNIPVVAWGGGSSLEGNPIPSKGGMILNMTYMNKVLDISPDDLQVEVQPGILGDTLNKKLEKKGLFFPAFPASANVATIGGMIANNAGGMYAVGYGVVGDQVMKIEVVLADGRIIEVGSRSIKSVAGYDLKSLFIGSEGTLGIITKAILKVKPIPEAKAIIIATFKNDTAACLSALAIGKSDINPVACEYMDRRYITMANKVRSIGLSNNPALLIELHEPKELIQKCILLLEALCRNQKAIDVQVATDSDSVWEFRRAVRPALFALHTNYNIVPGDCAVPVSKLASLLSFNKKVCAKNKVQYVAFGHAGDGNIHIWYMYKKGDGNSYKKAEGVNHEVIVHALSLGGTSTGEHGIGIGRRPYLLLEHPTSVGLMKEIKKVLDPKGILNPGKIFI